jgi:hypothetical protein
MCDLNFGWRASIKGGFGVFKCVHNFQPFNEILPMFSQLRVRTKILPMITNITWNFPLKLI